MDIKNLTRDSQRVHTALAETPKGALVAVKALKIYVPLDYEDRKMAVIANEIRTTAIFAIVVDDQFYAVSLVTAMMQLTPSSTTVIKIDGEDYYEFSFDKGSEVCPNVNLVKDDKLVYRIYDSIIAKGHIPWFLSYEDVGKLFTTALSHGGIRLGPNNIPLEMIAASISRQSKDRTKYYRHTLKSMAEQYVNPPAFVPFRSVIYGATNTTAKLMGAYFDDGLMSALVNPSEKTEGVETILRK